MNNITLGKYIPLDSPIHRMDPRAKIIAMFVLMICIFIPTGFYGYGVIALILAICCLMAKLELTYILRSFKPMLFMMIFLSVVNAFFIKTGDPLFTFKGFTLYSGAITQTLYIVLRLMLMIIITTLLTATTKPLDMTLGIEDLLSPLQKLHFPTHDVAMMISLALRFIPQLLEEADRIMKAQASRGVDMENGSIREKIRAILSLIVPLFVSCFQKADDLADAMEARGYVVGAKRVRYKQLKLRFGDVMTIILVNVLMAGFIAASIWMGKNNAL